MPVYIDNDGNLAASMESRLYPQYREMTVLSITDVISCGIITGGSWCGVSGLCQRGGPSHGKHPGNPPVFLRKIRLLGAILLGPGPFGGDQPQTPVPLTDIGQFIDLVQEQDPDALEVLDRFIHNLAVGLSNIIFFMNSEIIILNSHLIHSLPYLMPEIMKDIVLPITTPRRSCSPPWAATLPF